jgi:hypothetical protein
MYLRGSYVNKTEKIICNIKLSIVIININVIINVKLFQKI